MTKKITKLTEGQIEKFSTYRDEYLAIGLSTERADRARAEAGAKLAYEVAGLPQPEIFVWLDSPMAGAWGAAVLSGPPRPFGAQVRAQVWAQVWAQVRAQVGDQVWAQVGDQVGDQVGAQVWAQVRDQVGDQVGAQVGDQVRAQVWDQVRAQVWDQVGAQVGDQVWAQVVRAGYGQHDANWLSFYKFFSKECGVNDADRLCGLDEIARSCGWWWPFQRAVIFTERPEKISRDEQNRLHSENGAALLYRDGFSIHAWHGTRVPAHWLDDRASLDPNEVIKAENVEQRAAGAAICGWPKMLSVLNAKTIDDSGSDDIGQLIELRLPGLNEPGRFLKAYCSRNGWIVEGLPRIDDYGLPIETAIHGQAWRVGLHPSEFRVPEVRT